MYYVFVGNGNKVHWGFQANLGMIPDGADQYDTESEMLARVQELDPSIELEEPEELSEPVPVQVANPNPIDADTSTNASDGGANIEDDNMSDGPILNMNALGGTAAKVSKGSQYLLAIVVGGLAALAVFAGVLKVAGQNMSGDGIMSGIIGAALLVAVYWIVRSDNRAAEAAGDKLLITTNTSFDIAVMALAFIGMVIIAAFAGANVAVFIAAGLAAIVGYLSGRWVWTGIKPSSDS